jgi:hypothetical protein
MVLQSGDKNSYTAQKKQRLVAEAVLLDNLVAFPTGRLGESKIFARMRLLGIPVLTHKGIGILLLIEITKGVIHFAVFALVGSNCHVSTRSACVACHNELTVEEQIAHRSMAFGHLPVVYSDIRSLQLFPLRKAASVQIFELAGVGNNSLLFEISDQAMNHTGTHEVCEE